MLNTNFGIFNAKSIAIRFKGHTFRGFEVSPTEKHISSIGINTELFSPGITVALLLSADYTLFCQVAGRCPETTQGFYPFAETGKEAAVNEGRLEALPKESRKMILPLNSPRLVFLHEMMHDVFLGGMLTSQQRIDFVHLFIGEARNILRDNPNSDKARFIQAAWESQFKSEELYHAIDGPITDRRLVVLANEAFAYSGETLLGGQDFPPSAIPPATREFLSQIKLTA